MKCEHSENLPGFSGFKLSVTNQLESSGYARTHTLTRLPPSSTASTKDHRRLPCRPKNFALTTKRRLHNKFTPISNASAPSISWQSTPTWTSPRQCRNSRNFYKIRHRIISLQRTESFSIFTAPELWLSSSLDKPMNRKFSSVRPTQPLQTIRYRAEVQMDTYFSSTEDQLTGAHRNKRP